MLNRGVVLFCRGTRKAARLISYSANLYYQLALITNPTCWEDPCIHHLQLRNASRAKSVNKEESTSVARTL
eukprot:1424775-Amphidinium_carterae.1